MHVAFRRTPNGSLTVHLEHMTDAPDACTEVAFNTAGMVSSDPAGAVARAESEGEY